MIAGGTGLTPMLQLVRAVFRFILLSSPLFTEVNLGKILGKNCLDPKPQWAVTIFILNYLDLE